MSNSCGNVRVSSCKNAWWINIEVTDSALLSPDEAEILALQLTQLVREKRREQELNLEREKVNMWEGRNNSLQFTEDGRVKVEVDLEEPLQVYVTNDVLETYQGK